MKILLENGKYEYCFSEKTGKQSILRYGKMWREETGDNLLYAMASRIKELEEQNSKLRSCVELVSEAELVEVEMGIFKVDYIGTIYKDLATTTLARLDNGE